ncbi:MAG TPA: aspartate/glutamate racemase family protein [Dermatophilaceae bacterium]|nr:aspartate/glutamate racemase family protein [Dermatophilaceae bacterium]
MRIMFLNQSPADPEGGAAHQRISELLNSYASPGTEVELHYPDDYPGGGVMDRLGDQNMLNGLHHWMETPALVKKIVSAAEDGYDAVIQSNTFDPGVEAGRLAVRIPVIGLFKTALHVAFTLGNRIGVIVPLASHIPYVWRILDSYGVASHITDVNSIGVYGKDLDERRDEIKELAASQILELAEASGSEVIIPLGGALIPYVVRPEELTPAIGVPVLNTKAIGIAYAELCVKTGLSHSPVAYPGIPLTSADVHSFAFPGARS